MNRRYIIKISIVVLAFVIVGCSSNKTELKTGSQEQSTIETANTQSTKYFVNKSQDDAEEGMDGQIDVSNEDLDLGQLSGFESAKAIGMRFEEIQVSKGQVLKNAFLEFTMEGNSVKAKPTELIIQAEMSPNAKSFQKEAANISSRELSKASIKWSPETWNPKQAHDHKPSTPDLSPIIQEVVNQDDWQEGNALVLIITGTGERDAVSFDGGGKEEGPVLHIELE